MTWLAGSEVVVDSGRMLAVAGMPWVRRVFRASAYLAASALLLAALVLLLLFAVLFVDGLGSAIVHPQVHAGVSELPSSGEPIASLTGPRDFDGDGVADRLETRWAERDPPFGRSTLQMVYVHSGRTGRTLLAHATNSSLEDASWCGDADGNGTMDVYAPADRIVLGYTKRR